MKKLLCAAFFCLLTAPAFGATNWFISTGGSNSNAGTIGSPFLTLGRAMASAVPGDTINYRAGDYFDPFRTAVITVTSGTAGNPITVQAYQSEFVQIFANFDSIISLDNVHYLTVKNLTLNGTNGRLWTAPFECVTGIQTGYTSDHLIFQNIDLIGSGTVFRRGSGILLQGPFTTLQNVSVHGWSTTGVYIESDDTVMDRMTVYDNGIMGGACNGDAGPGNGIQIYNSGSPTPSRNILSNSVFHDNHLTNIEDVGVDSLIINNVSYAGGMWGIQVGIDGNICSTPGSRLYNNTVYGNANGIKLTDGACSAVAVNNIAYANTSNDKVVNLDSGTPVITNNICGSSGCSLTGDPLMIAPGSMDFRLGLGSPAIGAGANESAIFTTDIRGLIRSVPWDIGAYKADSPITPPVTGMISGETIASRTVTAQAIATRVVTSEFMPSGVITYVTSTGGTSANNNTVLSSSVNTSGANLLVCQVADYLAVGAGTLTDSKSNTWTPLTTCSVDITRLQGWYVIGATVGSGHTFSYGATGSFPAINCIALANVKTSSPLDTEAHASATGVTFKQAGSVTPGANNAVVLGGLARDNSNISFVDSGMTMANQQEMTPNFSADLSYKIQTTAAALNPTWSWSAGSDACVSATVFKAP